MSELEALRERVAVLTEERDGAERSEREAWDRALAAEARVAVLEAGLREVVAAHDDMVTEQDLPSHAQVYRLRDEVAAARDALGQGLS